MLKNIAKILFVFVLGAGGGIFADQILWPYFVERPLFYGYRLDQAPVYVTEVVETTITENVALERAVEKVEKAVAAVRTKKAGGGIIEGSGLIVTADGLMVTFENLVPKGGSYTFFADGITPDFQILKRDAEKNLALIKLDASNLPTIGFADYSQLRAGQKVFAVGAFFEAEGFERVVNDGIIKKIDENGFLTSISDKSFLNGGPVFNVAGEVVGLGRISQDGSLNVVPISKVREFAGL